MTFKRLTPGPVVRIVLGLVFMTISIVLSALLLNLDSGRHDELLGARKAICETLALQISSLAGSGNMDTARQIIDLAVSRSNDLLSAGLRADGGGLLLASDEHEQRWRGVPLDGSTPSFAQVPIFRAGERWATLEAHFTPLANAGLDLIWLARVLAVVTVAGFIGYWLMMRRALRELDPSAVVPARVRAAMNALAEGVMLLDEHGAPVLVNESLCERLGRPERELLEQPLSAFDWSDPHTGEAAPSLPWSRALRSGERQTSVPLGLQTPGAEPRTFVVNVVPVGDDKGHTRGALVTFDDVTDVERKNTELRRTLSLLEVAREEVEQQNRDLERLASRDPLTDCLNRRSFFARFEALLAECRANGQPLTCLMADIDHFKRVNDRYGHAAGDEVIKLVAGILRAGVREQDMVCRYGGEEFCIALPGMDMDAAEALAERLRRTVQHNSGSRLTSGAKVTSSCGVSLLHDDVKDASALVELADEALYAAKEGGRNRVVRIDRLPATQHAAPETQAAQPPPSTTQADADDGSMLAERVGDLETALLSRTRALRHRHTHDPVTTLPNRNVLAKRIARLIDEARRGGCGFGLLWLSLDTLPRLCNALGPTAGDHLLRETGKRLMGAVRSSDMVGTGHRRTLSRLGTQEFGVLVSGLDTPAMASAMVRQLFDALVAPVSIDGHEVQLNFSIGVALYPLGGADANELLKNAGAACQFCQQQGERNSWRIYTQDMNSNALRQLTLETRLRHAIERKEFLLHYQPKVSLADGRIAGVEALIRWRQADMGMVSPAEFVPVAEQAGLIGAIGEWALDEACRQARAWRDEGFEGLSVAVNVSAVQFRDPSFAERVATRLRAYALPPAMLELELTESTIMRDLELATSTIRELAGMGVRIAVDDFGTGHSSLSYLRAFPVHALKIDRSFLNEIEQGADETLVAAIASMAHGLGLHVVAEGVERESQVPLLRRHRCHEAQGYLFCRPVPADGISDILSGRTELPAVRALHPVAWRDLLRRGRRASPQRASGAERVAADTVRVESDVAPSGRSRRVPPAPVAVLTCRLAGTAVARHARRSGEGYADDGRGWRREATVGLESMRRILLPKKLLQIVRRPICVELDDGKPGPPRRYYFDDTLRLGYGDDCEIRLDGDGSPSIVCGLARTHGPLQLWSAASTGKDNDERLSLQVDGQAVAGGVTDIGDGSQVEVLDRVTGRRYRLRVESPSRWSLRPRVLLAVVAVLSIVGALYGGYVYWSLRGAQEQIGRTEQRLRQTELGVEDARSALADVERRIATTEIEVATAVAELRDAQATSGVAIRVEFERRLAALAEQSRTELASISQRDDAARETLQAEARAAIEALRRELSDRMVDAYREFKDVETRLYQSLGQRLAAVEPPGVRFKRVLAEARGAVLFLRTSFTLTYTRSGQTVTQEGFGTGFFVAPAGADAGQSATGLALTAQHVLYPWRFERALQVLMKLGLVELDEHSVAWSAWTTGSEVLIGEGADGQRRFDLEGAWRSDDDRRALRLLYMPTLVTAEELVESPVGVVAIAMPVPGAGDVAVLQTMDFDTQRAPLVLARSAGEALDEALAVGYPLSRLENGRAEPQAVIGFVRREPDEILELNTTFNPGLSGGPVLDRDGHVTGMAIGIVDSSAYGLAIPASTLAGVLAAAAESVRAEERRLLDSGCDPGPVDGVFDASTWDAYSCEARHGE